MRKIKKILAAVLAASLVLGSTVTAFAADGTAVGEGQATIDILPDDVISVTVPTSVNFDFDVDGSKMLYNSDTTAYENATLLFKGTKKSTSAVLTISNNSTCSVNVCLIGTVSNANAASTNEVDVKDDDQLASATAPAISLKAIESSSAGVPKTEAGTVSANFKADGSVSANVSMNSASANYIMKHGVSQNNICKFVYEAKTGSGWDQGNVDTKYFVIKGDATPESATIKWDNIKKAPKLTVTYVILKDKTVDVTSKNGGAAAKTYSVSVANPTVTVEKAITSVTLKKADGTTVNWTLGTQYTLSNSDKTLTVKATAAITNNPGGKLVLGHASGSTTVEFK